MKNPFSISFCAKIKKFHLEIIKLLNDFVIRLYRNLKFVFLLFFCVLLREIKYFGKKNCKIAFVRHQAMLWSEVSYTYSSAVYLPNQCHVSTCLAMSFLSCLLEKVTYLCILHISTCSHVI